MGPTRRTPLAAVLLLVDRECEILHLEEETLCLRSKNPARAVVAVGRFSNCPCLMEVALNVASTRKACTRKSITTHPCYFFTDIFSVLKSVRRTVSSGGTTEPLIVSQPRSVKIHFVNIAWAFSSGTIPNRGNLPYCSEYGRNARHSFHNEPRGVLITVYPGASTILQFRKSCTNHLFFLHFFKQVIGLRHRPLTTQQTRCGKKSSTLLFKRISRRTKKLKLHHHFDQL